MIRHWSEQYLGIPWENGAQGPDAFDCWAFVRHVQRAHFDREVPIIAVNADNRAQVRVAFERHPERQRWTECTDPVDGDCVLFSKAGQVDHIGLWLSIAGGKILHAIPHSGVVLTSMEAARRLGWGPIKFYRFAP